jgi:hypothetical protein
VKSKNIEGVITGQRDTNTDTITITIMIGTMIMTAIGIEGITIEIDVLGLTGRFRARLARVGGGFCDLPPGRLSLRYLFPLRRKQ